MDTHRLFREMSHLFRALSHLSDLSIEPSRLRSGHHVLIFPGYGALPQLYRGLQRGLEQFGFRAHLVDVGFNVHSLDKSLSLVDGEARRLCTGEPFSIVGHSLGGGVGAAMLALTEWKRDIRTVVTLGTPFLGCPWRPLRRLVLATTGISEQTFKDNHDAFLAVSSQIISIVSPSDDIAPPDRCFIPESRMRQIILPGTHKIAHTEMPEHPLVHRKIERALSGYHPFPSY